MQPFYLKIFSPASILRGLGSMEFALQGESLLSIPTFLFWFEK
jgi:hypothetical protein